MKTRILSVKIALAALLFATFIQSSFAAPPHTGIRGQTLIHVPGFWVEVEPELWLGDGGFSFGWPASFDILSAHSNREVAHVSTGSDGSFEVSLPPGKYVVVPDTLPWYAPMTDSFEVTVRTKLLTDAFIYYESVPISVSP